MTARRWTALARAAYGLPVIAVVVFVLAQPADRPAAGLVCVLVGLAFTAAAATASTAVRRLPNGGNSPAAASGTAPELGRQPTHRGRTAGTRWGGRVAGALVVGAVGAAYFATLSPTTNATDSVEFQLVAATLRIAHAPGYGLYTVLGHVVTWLPVGDVAWRLNALSAWCGMIGAALAFTLARRLANDPLAGVVAALALAFTPQLWSQAVLTEVYTLNIMIVLGILACLARDRGRRDARWRLAALTLSGLGFTHHLTTVFLYPVVAWLVLMRDPRLLTRAGDVTRSALAFIVGLAPLLYFPWRWQAVNGVPLDVPTLFGFVTGRNYPGLFDLGRLPAEPARWGLLRHVIALAYGPLPLALAAVGVVALVVRRRIDWAVALAAVFGAYALFYLGYFAWDGWVVFLPALAALAVTAGIGAAFVAQWPTRTGRATPFIRALVAAGCAVALSASVVRVWPRVDASRGWPGQAAADAALAEPIPAGARLVVDPTIGAGFLFARHLKGVRPDLDVVYADWPVGRRALQDPLAGDRPVVAYGIPRDALPSDGVRAVPIGRAYALVAPTADVRPAGMAPPRAAVVSADGGSVVTGWRALSSRARANDGRVVPGDELIVQLQLQVRREAAPSDNGPVRLRLVADDTGRPAATGAADLPPLTGAADASIEVPLALAREIIPGTYTLQYALGEVGDAGDAADALAWRTLGTVTVAPITRRLLTDDPAFGDVVPVRRAWPDGTMLVGLEAPATVGAGQPLDIRAYWAHRPSTPALGGTVTLEDPRVGAGGVDGRAAEPVVVALPVNKSSPVDRLETEPSEADLPGGVWPGGSDAVWVTRHTLAVPSGAPCDSSLSIDRGRCLLGRRPFGPRLVRRSDSASDVRAIGRAWPLPRVAVRPPPSGLERPARFEGGIALEAFRPRHRVVRPGEWLTVDTRWVADAAPIHRDKAFVQLLDAVQGLRSGSDREVLYGAEPMDSWRRGDVHSDVFFVRVPSDMPPGPALVQIGLYDPKTRARRAVLGADGERVDDRVLTGIYVEAAERELPLPASGAAETDITFDGGPRLTAIAVPPDASPLPGEAFTVTLRWHVDAAPTRDWTVFVHLLSALPAPADPAAIDSAATELSTTDPAATDPAATESSPVPPASAPVAQADGPPLGPHFPTRLWSPGTTLWSTHVLRWPDVTADASVNGAEDPGGAAGPGRPVDDGRTPRWTLAIGLYDGATLERATVHGQLDGGVVDGTERRVRWPLPTGAHGGSATAP